MSGRRQGGSINSLVLPVYLPAILLSLATSAILPLVPSLALGLGATLPVAGLVAGAPVVGQVVATLPAGWLVGRFGERPVMITAGLVALVGTAGAAFAPTIVWLGLALLVVGFSVALYSISRHAYLTVHADLAVRGRSLSLLGASMRVGAVVGPLVGAGAAFLGSTFAPLVVAAIAVFAAIIVQVLFIPQPTDAQPATDKTVAAPMSVWVAMTTDHGLLFRVAATASLISGLRTARTILVPLVAASLGLDASQTLLVVGLAAVLDLSLFYAGGSLMDRYGPLAAGIPSILGLSFGMMGLAFTTNTAWFWVLVLALGVANGIGSGFLLTVASELVPRNRPGPLISAFRIVSDSGAALTPFVIAGISAVSAVSVASGAFGVLGMIGAGLSLRVMGVALRAARVHDE